MNGKVLERYAELMIDKIRQMSAGEWQKPWFTPRTGLPQNISGRPYNSMNRLMLYIEMDRMGYTLPVFMTFRQLKDENLMIIKGSHALSAFCPSFERKTKKYGNDTRKQEPPPVRDSGMCDSCFCKYQQQEQDM